MNHLRLFDTFFVFPEMMLLRAWERMCNGFSVGYQTLKLYGPALVTGAWSLPRVGIVGMSDGLDEDEVFQCHASSCGCKMHIDEL